MCHAADDPAQDLSRPPAEADRPFPVGDTVQHDSFGVGVVMSYDSEPPTVTVLFEAAGYRTLAVETVLEHDLLTAVPT